MSRKWAFLCSLAIFLIATAVTVGIFTASPAFAQCGDIPADSSCFNCHETQGADPVYGEGEWHKIHASKDCCWNCHGGNTQTQDKDLAHLGMTAHPLQDIYTDCYSCHPNDYSERAERFALALGVIPDSSATATPAPVIPVTGHPIVILPASTPGVASHLLATVAFGGLVFSILALFLVVMRYQHLHKTSHA